MFSNVYHQKDAGLTCLNKMLKMVEMKYFMDIGWVSIHKQRSKVCLTMFSLFDSLSLKKLIFKPNNVKTKMSLLYKHETEIWSNRCAIYFRE